MSDVKQILAYFDSSHDFPEEIAIAAGLDPVKILGDVHMPNDPADQYAQNFTCPQARSFMTDALANSGSWAGIVLAHGCDATHRFYDIWKMHVETPFLYFIDVPMNYGTASAAKFFRAELNRFARALEAQFGVEITNEALKQAIETSNGIKRKLQQLGAMRATKDIPNHDYFDVCMKAVTLPRDDLDAALDETIAAWSDRPEFPADKKKVFLTGSDITYVEWFDLLEEANMRVVRDDLSIGERYFATTIPDKDDPIDAIIDYYFNIPRPATKNPPDPRWDYILAALKASGIDTIVSQNVKFCEVYAYDSVQMQKAMKKAGYRFIHLEREFSPAKDAQTLNRLEAFMETKGEA